jgi:HAD superfamily hydrolase (TIGR01509 family)
MDGLLVNTEELYTQVGHKLLSRRGREFTTELKDLMTGLPGPVAFSLMIQQEHLTDSIEQLEHESEEIFEQLLPSQLRLLPGVHELLERLDRRKMPRCVATSSSPEFAKRVLSQVSILDRFDFVVTAQDVVRGKPAPDIYWQAAKRMAVSANQMMVLEDSHNGCKAAIASGACAIAVPGDHSQTHDFTGAHYRANSLLDPQIALLLDA